MSSTRQALEVVAQNNYPCRHRIPFSVLTKITVLFWTHLTLLSFPRNPLATSLGGLDRLSGLQSEEKNYCSCWDSNGGNFIDWGRRSHIGHPCGCQSRGHPQVPVPAARPVRRGTCIAAVRAMWRTAGRCWFPCPLSALTNVTPSGKSMSVWVSCLSSCPLCHHSAFFRHKIQSCQEARFFLAPTSVFVPSFKSLTNYLLRLPVTAVAILLAALVSCNDTLLLDTHHYSNLSYLYQGVMIPLCELVGLLFCKYCWYVNGSSLYCYN